MGEREHHDWPLPAYTADANDPPIEQLEEFLAALDSALSRT
jgi:hypothetical protein